MFKVNNKDTRTGIFIVNFEDVIAGWGDFNYSCFLTTFLFTVQLYWETMVAAPVIQSCSEK